MSTVAIASVSRSISRFSSPTRVALSSLRVERACAATGRTASRSSAASVVGTRISCCRCSSSVRSTSCPLAASPLHATGTRSSSRCHTGLAVLGRPGAALVNRRARPGLQPKRHSARRLFASQALARQVPRALHSVEELRGARGIDPSNAQSNDEKLLLADAILDLRDVPACTFQGRFLFQRSLPCEVCPGATCAFRADGAERSRFSAHAWERGRSTAPSRSPICNDYRVNGATGRVGWAGTRRRCFRARTIAGRRGSIR
jgi:hypothetical protein